MADRVNLPLPHKMIPATTPLPEKALQFEFGTKKPVMLEDLLREPGLGPAWQKLQSATHKERRDIAGVVAQELTGMTGAGIAAHWRKKLDEGTFQAGPEVGMEMLFAGTLHKARALGRKYIAKRIIDSDSGARARGDNDLTIGIFRRDEGDLVGILSGWVPPRPSGSNRPPKLKVSSFFSVDEDHAREFRRAGIKATPYELDSGDMGTREFLPIARQLQLEPDLEHIRHVQAQRVGGAIRGPASASHTGSRDMNLMLPPARPGRAERMEQLDVREMAQTKARQRTGIDDRKLEAIVGGLSQDRRMSISGRDEDTLQDLAGGPRRFSAMLPRASERSPLSARRPTAKGSEPQQSYALEERPGFPNNVGAGSSEHGWEVLERHGLDVDDLQDPNVVLRAADNIDLGQLDNTELRSIYYVVEELQNDFRHLSRGATNPDIDSVQSHLLQYLRRVRMQDIPDIAPVPRSQNSIVGDAVAHGQRRRATHDLEGMMDRPTEPHLLGADRQAVSHGQTLRGVVGEPVELGRAGGDPSVGGPGSAGDAYNRGQRTSRTPDVDRGEALLAEMVEVDDIRDVDFVSILGQMESHAESGILTSIPYHDLQDMVQALRLHSLNTENAGLFDRASAVRRSLRDAQRTIRETQGTRRAPNPARGVPPHPGGANGAASDGRRLLAQISNAPHSGEDMQGLDIVRAILENGDQLSQLGHRDLLNIRQLLRRRRGDIERAGEPLDYDSARDALTRHIDRNRGIDNRPPRIPQERLRQGSEHLGNVTGLRINNRTDANELVMEVRLALDYTDEQGAQAFRGMNTDDVQSVLDVYFLRSRLPDGGRPRDFDATQRRLVAMRDRLRGE